MKVSKKNQQALLAKKTSTVQFQLIKAMSLSSTSSDDAFTTQRPSLKRMNANRPPSQILLAQSQTDNILDEDSAKIKDLAYAIYSAARQVRKKSISRKILLKIIKMHLHLSSTGKSVYYLNELQRLKYIYVPSFATDKRPVYAFCSKAFLTFEYQSNQSKFHMQ